MPKGVLLHHYLTDCIDINWITETVIKNQDNIFLRDFSKDIKTLYPLRLILMII